MHLPTKAFVLLLLGWTWIFKGNPFGPMPNLMATAEYVTKVHAVCTRTGNLAQYSFRKSNDDKLVLLGEVNEYEPLSRSAFYKAMTKEKIKEIKVVDPLSVAAKKTKN